MSQYLSDRLKELRSKKRWTLVEVANKLGLKGHSTYSNWEYNRTEPDSEMLNKIAELYGVSVDWLTGRKGAEIEVTEDNLHEIKKSMIEKVKNMTIDDAKFISDMYDRMKK